MKTQCLLLFSVFMLGFWSCHNEEITTPVEQKEEMIISIEQDDTSVTRGSSIAGTLLVTINGGHKPYIVFLMLSDNGYPAGMPWYTAGVITENSHRIDILEEWRGIRLQVMVRDSSGQQALSAPFTVPTTGPFYPMGGSGGTSFLN